MIVFLFHFQSLVAKIVTTDYISKETGLQTDCGGITLDVKMDVKPQTDRQRQNHVSKLR